MSNADKGGMSRRRMMQLLGAAVAVAIAPAVVVTLAPPATPEIARQPWTGRDRRPRWIGHC